MTAFGVNYVNVSFSSITAWEILLIFFLSIAKSIFLPNFVLSSFPTVFIKGESCAN